MLDVSNLNVSYGKQKVLRDVAFSLKGGEVVTLIGSNAAGKSTTLRTLVGLKKQASGTISFNGADIGAMETVDRVKAGLVLVPEGRQIFPRLTVNENLLMGAYHRADRDHVDDDLERIFTMFPRLRERRVQRAGSMSGGEQQMLVIGRALMARPRLLLLDEPSLGIAPKLVQDIARSIVAINRDDQVSVLLVEQNSRMALRISRRAYALTTGEVALSGPSADLLTDDRVRALYLGGEV